jgi:hypothetical protein
MKYAYIIKLMTQYKFVANKYVIKNYERKSFNNNLLEGRWTVLNKKVPIRLTSFPSECTTMVELM